MSFDAIKKYLLQQTKMSHVHKTLITNHLRVGHDSAKVKKISLDLVQNDLKQIEYYTDSAHNIVGRVLN
jgi:hypothetical protein